MTEAMRDVDDACHRRIERFLLAEARLLDSEAWSEWLALMTEDIHYWMPAVENRRRNDRLGAREPGRGAYFDDSLRELTIRVSRFRQPSAWAEDPPTRHLHVIANVEAFHAPLQAPGHTLDRASAEYLVYSTFVNYRSRNEADNDMLMGRREDVLREVDGQLKIARRKVLITQSLLTAKNLNTFF